MIEKIFSKGAPDDAKKVRIKNVEKAIKSRVFDTFGASVHYIIKKCKKNSTKLARTLDFFGKVWYYFINLCDLRMEAVR